MTDQERLQKTEAEHKLYTALQELLAIDGIKTYHCHSSSAEPILRLGEDFDDAEATGVDTQLAIIIEIVNNNTNAAEDQPLCEVADFLKDANSPPDAA